MDKKLLVATLLAIFLVPFLVVGRAEIVTGETAVTYEGTITFSVSTYIEVDFGPGWQNLAISKPIRPGTSGIYNVGFDPQSTYIRITSNTNVNVDIAFGVPSSNVYIQNITIGNEIVERGSYSKLAYNVAPGTTYAPSAISVGIDVPLGVAAGTHSESFTICVVISNHIEYCPAL